MIKSFKTVVKSQLKIPPNGGFSALNGSGAQNECQASQREGSRKVKIFPCLWERLAVGWWLWRNEMSDERERVDHLESAVEAERERCYRAGINWLLKKFPNGSPIAQDQLRSQFRSALGL
jgi:hypothetical protein